MRDSFAASLLAAVFVAATSVAQVPLTSMRIAGGLDSPVWIGSPPGDNRLFALEQNQADVQILEHGQPLEPPFLDLSSRVFTDGGERGLLGLAFDPGYATNGLLYVNYTRLPDGATVVERYHALDANTADPSSGVVIFGPVAQPQSNHNGGNIDIGPDVKLYIGMGDGGNFDDWGTGHVAGGNAQSGGQLLGKMIRINTDGTIPADNPFISPTDGFLDPIWDYGLRNPWRWSFDRLKGDLWIADVGQGSREEIDFQAFGSPAGRNFGWRCMEGWSCTGNDGCTCNGVTLTKPIFDYGHGGGSCAVVGGHVYRGAAIPGLQGEYFFADYCSGKIWSLTYENHVLGTVKDRTAELAPGLGLAINSITSFGEDSNGEILIVDYGGEIFRIVRDPFSDLGGALAGSAGNPLLKGDGGMLAKTLNALRLLNAMPGAPAFLFISASHGAAPLKGGILQAFPYQLMLMLTTTASGILDLPFTVPVGIPGGTQILFQYAIVDAGAVQGVALSNALEALMP